MIKATFFSNFLTTSDQSAALLLKKLSYLDHVIYLKNVNQPVIYFNAENYLCVQNNATSFYKKNTHNQYIKQKETPVDFLKMHSQAKPNQHWSGGYVGFIGYDYAANLALQKTPLNQPALFIGTFLYRLINTAEGWYFESTADDAAHVFDQIKLKINQPCPEIHFSLNHPLNARWNKTDYQKSFHAVQDYIIAGDCYQINLTQEFTSTCQGSLVDTAAQLWQLTDAPYSGYLRIKDFELLSCSPELFIDFKDQRHIITKPIKGTMPRFDDPVLDEQSKQTLKHSEKDMAENVMIVDLLRNDLSVYAEIGSVKTPKLFNIESFNQVHHLVSEIEATLKPEICPFEMLITALPGGSITGAPKIRAMQIIDELEGGARGAYCGSMGYFNFDGTGSWNILIRSIQKYQDHISLWAGGGITIASDCDAEYQECFDKVEAILNLLNTWHTPE